MDLRVQDLDLPIPKPMPPDIIKPASPGLWETGPATENGYRTAPSTNAASSDKRNLDAGKVFQLRVHNISANAKNAIIQEDIDTVRWDKTVNLA